MAKFIAFSILRALPSAILLLTSVAASAQLIDPINSVEEYYFAFNADSIANKGIRSIDITLKEKPSLRTIRDYGERYRYVFDHRGRLMLWYRVAPTYQRGDTTKVFWIHEDDRIKEKLTEMKNYIQLEKWQKTEENKYTYLLLTKNRKSAIYDTIAVEYQEVIKRPSVTTTLIKGSPQDGTSPYEKRVEERDEKGRILEISDWVRFSLQRQIQLKYEQGLLVKKIVATALDSVVTDFTYKNGVVEEMDIYGPVDEYMTIVNTEDGLIKGVIRMLKEREYLFIYELEYTFR